MRGELERLFVDDSTSMFGRGVGIVWLSQKKKRIEHAVHFEFATNNEAKYKAFLIYGSQTMQEQRALTYKQTCSLSRDK